MYHSEFLLDQKADVNSDCKLAKAGEKKQIPEDRISQLSDDILVLLLFHLSLKEAGITSILSKRWEHVWKFTRWLKCDASKTLNEIPSKFSCDRNNRACKRKNAEIMRMERVKYVNWLDKVLKAYKGSSLEEFSVVFGLNSMYKHEIDSWLQFAFARRVRSLEVNLLQCYGLVQCDESCYTFPNHLLPAHSPGPAVIKSLKVLILKSVCVSNEVLQFFLSNCPCLESLLVHGSASLEDFEVSGPSLVLKHLKIVACPKMMALNVCNTNLISLEVLGCLGYEVIVHVENLPLLVEVSFGLILTMGGALKSLSSCLSQLEVLKLHMSTFTNVGTCEYPSLPKLKQLVVYDDISDSTDLLKCLCLIKAAPYLKEFVLQIIWSKPARVVGELKKIPRCPLHYLRRVEFAGYYGCRYDLELIRFFLKNMVALGELIIDTRNQFYVQNPFMTMSNGLIEEGKTARALAEQQLEGKLPSQVGWSII